MFVRQRRGDLFVFSSSDHTIHVAGSKVEAAEILHLALFYQISFISSNLDL
jgi:hypothetical protein